VVQKDMLKIKAQTQAMKTQSTILLSKVANDQLLTNALFKVEELEEAKVNLEKQFLFSFSKCCRIIANFFF
jgi:hypothetical protein